MCNVRQALPGLPWHCSPGGQAMNRAAKGKEGHVWMPGMKLDALLTPGSNPTLPLLASEPGEVERACFGQEVTGKNPGAAPTASCELVILSGTG